MRSKIILIAGAVIAVLIIAIALLVILPSMSPDPAVKFQQAGALYTKSVDLANEGKYTEALKAADDALALNTPQLMPLIQSNRAGILVMLGKNTDAITAADTALASHENLTTTFSVAYFNKGNALKNLGRTDEAKAAYAKAHELDPTLVTPI
ncbi:tetratricopeptide repeat protein [Methanoregula sp.]|uniref:tetratricopeptide repeat protein n=1 Tax=Methanoregula sp. TaxID=2052170 RepID=UPI003565F235